MRKSDRHQLIQQIIRHNSIKNQGELMEKLKEHGVDSTQATISRDIRDLKIVKTIDTSGQPRFEIFDGHKKEEENDELRLKRMVPEIVEKITQVQFMTIVQTIPDNAHLLASVLDENKPEFLVATMASFDTLIIISKDNDDATKMAAFLQNYLN